MPIEMWIVLGILSVAVVLFITEWLRVDLVALLVVLALTLTGILTPAEAFSGFSNAAVLTIVFLFIVGGAVWQTGLAATIGQQILQIAGSDFNRLLVVLTVAVAFLSSFMSNTGTVAVLLPAVIVLARRARISPAKLLIPLSFGSMFGGAATLIGTPPNIIVHNLLRDNGFEPFEFFSFLPMGLLLTVVGVFYMLYIGRQLLPERRADENAVDAETSQELLQRYHLPENLHRLRIPSTSALDGQQLDESSLFRDFGVTVLRIMRPPAEPYAFSLTALAHNRADRHRVRDAPIIPEPTTQLRAGDALIVECSTAQLAAAAAHWDLTIEPPKPKDAKALVGKDTGIAEVVIPQGSRLIGETLLSSRFGDVYRLWVLSIRRPGAPETADIQAPDIKSMQFQFGDVLLVQGAWPRILTLRNQKRDFIVLGNPEAEMGAPRRHRSSLALLVLVTMIAALIWGGLPVVVVTLMAALAMILFGCLPVTDMYPSIDWKSVVLIAGMLPMSIAMEKVGLVNVAAEGLVNVLGVYDPRAVMAGLFVLTALFTQVISNTATTVVVAPIAFAAAQSLGLQPHAFLMTVAVAASAAFATPVASPTNTLVMGAGNYRFADYVKVGLPLIGVAMILALIFLPLIFPF